MTQAGTARRRFRGFSRASALLSTRIREAGESRGFAVSRLLTHWAEIAGADIAQHTRPVEVRYGRGGLGATLTLLTTGAHAPMVEMQKERLRARVNACYGYNAISAIRLTQTAATGFAEGQASFSHAPTGDARAQPEPEPAQKAHAARATEGVGDPALRDALAALGANILNKHKDR